MNDGRKHTVARRAATLTASLTIVGLGLTTSPAAAAPDTDIDSAQARVDRLSQQADAVAERADRVRANRDQVRKRLKAVQADQRQQRRASEKLRGEIAALVLEQSPSSAGDLTTSAQTTLPQDSETMLVNISIVSEDTGGRAEALAAHASRLEGLAKRRTALDREVARLTRVDRSTDTRRDAAVAKVARAAEVLEDLEAKAAEKRSSGVVGYATSQAGDSYAYGAAGPDSFDCSGLTMMAWSQAGVSLPHSSSAQYSAGPHVSESELQPGDLVFYYSPISHVGMYIGNGQIVHAANPGAGVRTDSLHSMPYVGAVRPG